LKRYIAKSLFLLLSLGGCAFTPIQQAGSNALAEAICLYEKKIDYGTQEFGRCLGGSTR
tara:strand:+ start:167 stop:343 length:177 start_codon:yes stop_codon:yes gene_type:complete